MTIRTIPLVAVLLLGAGGLEAQRAALVPLALPEGERIACEEDATTDPAKLRTRTYEVAKSQDMFGIPERVITVALDDEGKLFALVDMRAGLSTSEMVSMMSLDGGATFQGTRTRSKMDSAAAAAAVEAGDIHAIRKLSVDSTSDLSAADQVAAHRLVAWLKQWPCGTPATNAPPERRADASAPFYVVAVDVMPPSVPQGHRFAVIRNPDADTTDAIVILRDAQTVPVLDSAILSLRVARGMEVVPSRRRSIVAVTGPAPRDAALAEVVLAMLKTASVRELDTVGQGPTAVVPALPGQDGVRVRRP